MLFEDFFQHAALQYIAVKKGACITAGTPARGGVSDDILNAVTAYRDFLRYYNVILITQEEFRHARHFR
jgi:hypothetical protein